MLEKLSKGFPLIPVELFIESAPIGGVISIMW